MTRSSKGPRRTLRRLLIASATVGAMIGGLALAPAAYAGVWMQVSCVNPNESAAPSQGWTGLVAGSPGFGSDTGTDCSPGSPMFAILSTDAAAAVGTSENLQYTPPSGSQLVGGSVDVGLWADGYGYDASGTAIVYTPSFAYDGGDVFFQCAAGLSPCSDGTNDFTGTLTLPANKGGDLYVGAGCGGTSGDSCDEGGSDGGWSVADVYGADLLLSNSSEPTGTGFEGTLIEQGASGAAAELAFTAGDPQGPGVYQVLATIDGTTVYDATPNTNGGECVPVGVDAASLAHMFDYQQPCLQSEPVDLAVNTTQFANGPHTLKVVVTDAAGNSTTVLDEAISIDNAVTPSGQSSVSSTSPAAYDFTFDKSTKALSGSVRRSYAKSALTFAGTLASAGGAPAGGVTVAVWAAPVNGTTYTQIVKTTTNSAGQWALAAPKGWSRVLRVVAGSALPTTAGSATSVTETVIPSLSLRIAALASPKFVFTGTLAGAPSGGPRPLVQIEVRQDGSWQPIGAAVKVTAHGQFRFVYPVSPLLVGHSFAFRAVTPATSLWALGTSAVRYTTVP
jgi:hypothetical protein